MGVTVPTLLTTRGRNLAVAPAHPSVCHPEGEARRKDSFLRFAQDDKRYFEYNSTTSCSCAAIGMLVRCGRSSMRPLNDSLSTASQASGAPRDAWSIDALMAAISRDFMRTRISSPGFTT